MAKKNYYLNNKKLYECIVEYTARRRKLEAEGKPRPPIPEYAGECIMLICTRMGTRWNFINYSYRSEMVGDAILDCTAAFYNFDSDRFNSPFSYFSRVAWRAMLRKIFTEKVEAYVKHKSFQRAVLAGGVYDTPSDYTDPRAERKSTALSSSSSTQETSVGQEGSEKVISEFEALIARRKAARDDKEKAREAEKTEQERERETYDREMLGFSRIGQNNA